MRSVFYRFHSRTHSTANFDDDFWRHVSKMDGERNRLEAMLEFDLEPVVPFRLDLTAWALRRRPRNQIDVWDGVWYSRILDLEGVRLRLAVRQNGSAQAPRLLVRFEGGASRLSVEKLTRCVEWLLGTDFDLSAFYRLVCREPRLQGLIDGFWGLHPPRFPTLFEAAVNAICCQQLSLEVGLELMNRLARKAVPPEHRKTTSPLAFPRPREVAALPMAELIEEGFSRHKASAVLALAQMLTEKPDSLDELFAVDDDSARKRLLALKGIGPWSADYILLRGLGRVGVLPSGDVAATKSLKRWLNIDHGATHSKSKGSQHFPASWQPFKGMIYFHLLIRNLAERGYVDRVEQKISARRKQRHRLR